MFLLRYIPIKYCSKIKPNRIEIIPQKFTSQTMEQYFQIVSKNYDFVIQSNPPCSQIYVHHSDTPSSLLKKNAIHIYPNTMPPATIIQKYNAYIRSLEDDYKKSYNTCKTPAQVFHLQRRIKTDIRQRCRYIGKILGKHKHYNLFRSLNQLIQQKTLQEYKKNGIQVPLLGKNKIYPQGPVWLPTSDTYLKLFEQFIAQNNKTPQQVLDLGCGSGILSFILAKSYKNAKIYAVDANKYAIQTSQVNAASFGLHNIQAFLSDITNQDQFQMKLNEKKVPMKLDLIVSNPPWLIAKKNRYESQILDGVYDNKAKFLLSTFKIANKYLKDNNSRLILIYSDLSYHLGIQYKSIEQICKQNNFIIYSKLQSDYANAVNKQTPLSPYKLKSKIQLYQIGRA